MDKKLTFTRHAMHVLAERRIEPDWVRQVLAGRGHTEPDDRGETTRSGLGKVPEFGGRWLRVVYVESSDEIRVITAFFDRRVERRS